MPTEPAVRITGLRKSYGEVEALRGLDLEVARGEIFGFLGPNGAGKTTTIRCLLDLIRPNAGTARVLGLDPRADAVAVRARVGYLPGELHLDENMKVKATLCYFNSLRGGKASWNDVCRLAERLGLNLDLPVKNLSKGNKQKVGVVQALMHRPDLLLLDEPTSGLDPLMQQEVLHMIAEAREAGATVLFSSHILSEVEAVADRVGFIRRGALVEVAETSELANRSLTKVRVRFKEPASPQVLAHLLGVKGLRVNDMEADFQFEGEMEGLIKALATMGVSRLETERPSLEELFLAYYE